MEYKKNCEAASAGMMMVVVEGKKEGRYRTGSPRASPPPVHDGESKRRDLLAPAYISITVLPRAHNANALSWISILRHLNLPYPSC